MPALSSNPPVSFIMPTSRGIRLESIRLNICCTSTRIFIKLKICVRVNFRACSNIFFCIRGGISKSLSMRCPAAFAIIKFRKYSIRLTTKTWASRPSPIKLSTISKAPIVSLAIILSSKDTNNSSSMVPRTDIASLTLIFPFENEAS